ncbi:SpdD protein [Streptomyces sp. NPDC087317]|uniref:SpdD protein n=1 Tax=Streptomyces sp. NPDC087317 TaxID=3365784 RepID=UPI0037F3C0FC
MLRPKLPEIPTLPTTNVTPQQAQAPAPSTGRPLVPYVGIGAAVVVGGIVLTALLAAVAVTAISVAVTAVVLRSMLRGQHRR